MLTVNGLPPSFQVMPQNLNVLRVEYVWLDGYETPNLRSKVRCVRWDNETFETLVESLQVEPTDEPEELAAKDDKALSLIPTWGYDGSSTEQAPGGNSDCVLSPIRIYRDPFNFTDGIIVLCEVMDAETGEPHETNSRAKLREFVDSYATEKDGKPYNPFKEDQFIFAFEQEYFIFDPKTGKPYKWPEGQLQPPSQGRFVGS
jgi:glutamine synthetase